MAKKIKTKKEKQPVKKVIEKIDKVIKEKTMNKEETPLKTAQTIELKTSEKEPQIIAEETTPKSVENATPEVNTDDLVNVLKIPMSEAKLENEEPTGSSVKSAIFDDDQPEELADNEHEENLNDKYFGDQEDVDSDEDYDSSFFEDEELMSEMAVEVIDLGMQYLAMGIAQDFDNPEKYQVSDYKKKKIKKPLTILLRKRGTKVSPEIMFGVVLLVVYSPMIILAVQERKAKAKVKEEEMKKKRREKIARNIPSSVIEVDHEEIIRQRKEAVNTPVDSITPMVIPEKPKSKGRPKGSKDKNKRSTKGYKGNKNAK
jgi:hypothetical protein